VSLTFHRLVQSLKLVFQFLLIHL